MVAASVGSRMAIPDPVYKFIVFMLLMKVGLTGGQGIRDSNLAEILLPRAVRCADRNRDRVHRALYVVHAAEG